MTFNYQKLGFFLLKSYDATVARPNQWQIGLILICMIFTLNWLVLSIFSRWKTQQKKCCTLQCTKITYGKILRSMNSFYRCNFCDLRKWNFQYVRNNNFVIFVVYYRQTTATKHIPHLDGSEKYQNNIFFTLLCALSGIFCVNLMFIRLPHIWLVCMRENMNRISAWCSISLWIFHHIRYGISVRSYSMGFSVRHLFSMYSGHASIVVRIELVYWKSSSR